MKNTTLSAILLSAAICLTLTGCATSTASTAKNVIYTDNTTTTTQTEAASELTTTTPNQTEAASELTTTTPNQTEAASEQTTTTPNQTEAASEQTTTTPSQTTTASETTESAIAEQLVHGGRGTRDNNMNPSENLGGMNSQSSSSTISSDTTINVTMGSSALDTSNIFTKRELTQVADHTYATTVTVADNKTITITEEGVYIIKGSAKNCTITVNTDKNSKVQLVLDGVSITNDDFPAIYVISADKCFITTDSTSTLKVTGEFRSDGDTDTNAVIFSKDDLIFNGTGTLNITSTAANGIVGKDDIKVTGGTYNITAGKSGIKANDSIAICGGTFTITSGKDGLHSEYDEDGSVGWIYISDGEFDITASSDGIQATTILQIDGGTFNIKASEGLESTYVQINGGNITISASDDGINASQNTTAIKTPTVEINGGQLTITMGQGDTDGIDANGNIYVNGGTVSVTGNSTFDYDGVGQLNGGTVYVNGQQVTTLPNQMMGGGAGGFGGGAGGFGGGPGGFGGRM